MRAAHAAASRAVARQSVRRVMDEIRHHPLARSSRASRSSSPTRPVGSKVELRLHGSAAMDLHELLTRIDAEGRAYPRPQLAREHWTSLNGLWDFAIDTDARWTSPSAVHWS